MNVADAKDLNINDLLERLGHQATRRTAKDTWYKRPYGEEHHASFHVSRDGRAWFDFGTGTGGNIIDLAMLLGDCRDVSQALSYIESVTGHTGYTIPTIRQTLLPVKEYAYVIQRATTFQVKDKGGRYTEHANYLKRHRGIDPYAFAPYLSDLVYSDSHGKQKAGFGMKNYAGGYDVRRSDDFGKTSVGPKSFTHFPAAVEPEKAHWKAFYGMMDFGTFLTMRKNERQPLDTFHYLIIHGDAVAEQAADYLETIDVPYMEHFDHVDADGSGYRAMLKVMENGLMGGQASDRYEGFKDLNAWWQDRLGIGQKQPVIAPMQKPTPKPGM